MSRKTPAPTETTEKTTPLIDTDRASSDVPVDWDSSQSTLEELQRVRAMCAAVIETVDGARMLLQETYRDCATLSGIAGSLQRRLVQQTPPVRGRRGRSTRSLSSEAERTASRGGLDSLGREQARLEGALLVSRTAAHLVGNDLTTTIGLNELVRHRLRSGKSVDPKLLDDAIASAKRAAQHLQELQEIAHLELASGPSATLAVLDLALSKRKT